VLSVQRKLCDTHNRNRKSMPSRNQIIPARLLTHPLTTVVARLRLPFMALFTSRVVVVAELFWALRALVSTDEAARVP
jgi:hypothetical protein